MLISQIFKSFQNDESMGEIDQVIEEVIKLMEQSDEEKLSFSSFPFFYFDIPSVKCLNLKF